MRMSQLICLCLAAALLIPMAAFATEATPNPTPKPSSGATSKQISVECAYYFEEKPPLLQCGVHDPDGKALFQEGQADWGIYNPATDKITWGGNGFAELEIPLGISVLIAKAEGFTSLAEILVNSGEALRKGPYSSQWLAFLGVPNTGHVDAVVKEQTKEN